MCYNPRSSISYLASNLLPLNLSLRPQGVAFPYVMFVLAFEAINTFFVTDIYFHQKNKREVQAASDLRDAVLRLRLDGAFVAVPLWRVNLGPEGPHPAGASLSSYFFVQLVDPLPITRLL